MTGPDLKDPHAAAVRIECADRFLGSGFLIAPGMVVTAAHVLVDGATITVWHESGSYQVPCTAIHTDPADGHGDGRGFHPYPDLALLAVPGWHDHPVAVLAADEAAPGSDVLALGFSTFTPSPGAARDTLALRVVGRSGDYVAVQGGVVQPGLSGSMVVGGDGLVRGMLKASRSYKQDLGGWFLPLAPLTAFLRSAGVALGPAAPVAVAPTDAELVALLLRFPVTLRSDGRFDLLERMGEHLGLPHAFEVEERSNRRDHLHRVVAGCRHFRDERAALSALYTAMAELAPYDAALEELRLAVAHAAGGRASR